MNAWPHFLDENKLAGKWKPFIAKAMERFPDASWTHKLARWYLRRQRRAELRSSQSTWSRYSPAPTWKCTSMNWSIPPQSAQPPTGRSTYTLISASRTTCSLSATYSTRITQRDPRSSRLTVSCSASIGSMTITSGSISFPPTETKEQREADALRAETRDTSKLASANPWGAKLVAEMAAWKSHFEEASRFSTRCRAVSRRSIDRPARRGVDRSLAAYRPEYAAKAVALVENVVKYAPGDRAALTGGRRDLRDRERFSQARPFWNRIPQIEPGNADGYLEAATVFWGLLPV